MTPEGFDFFVAKFLRHHTSSQMAQRFPSLQRQRKHLLVGFDQMLVPRLRHRAGVFNLHGPPTSLVVGGFEVQGHAGFHGNVRRVGKERVIHFFRGTEQKWKLPCFETDSVA